MYTIYGSLRSKMQMTAKENIYSVNLSESQSEINNSLIYRLIHIASKHLLIYRVRTKLNLDARASLKYN